MPTVFTTKIPSAAPSIGGEVIVISSSTSISTKLSTEYLTDLDQVIRDNYGVRSSDIATHVDYVTSGRMEVDTPSNMSLKDVVETLEKAMADQLGIHDSNIENNTRKNEYFHGYKFK